MSPVSYPSEVPVSTTARRLAAITIAVCLSVAAQAATVRTGGARPAAATSAGVVRPMCDIDWCGQ